MEAMVGTLRVEIRRLEHARDIPLPAYATAGSAGCDLRAAPNSSVEIAPGERALIPTGLCLALPAGYEAQVRPRSGLALRHGLTTLNAPGTIDSDYRGEISVLLVNHGSRPYVVRRGHRIAQLVVAPVAQAQLQEVEELGRTSRGHGGFGSTGRR